jgi:hypothetical protein
MAERTHTHAKHSPDDAAALPKQGEAYRCEVCGMELEITRDCKCEDPAGPRFECCGQQLARS